MSKYSLYQNDFTQMCWKRQPYILFRSKTCWEILIIKPDVWSELQPNSAASHCQNLCLHTSHPGFTQLYPVQWDIHGNNSPLNCLSICTHTPFGSSRDFLVKFPSQLKDMLFKMSQRYCRINLTRQGAEKYILNVSFSVLVKIVVIKSCLWRKSL